MTILLDRIYHPSHRVTDLGEVERFFRTVFGRHSLPRHSLIMAGLVQQPPEFPADYCTFTPIADLFFDSLDPARYVWGGVQRYPSIESPHLDGYGWGVGEGIQEIWDRCRAGGIRLTDQWNQVVDSPVIPSASFKSAPLFWTLQEDTGLRYEFYPASSIGPYDHRSAPGWSLPPVSRHDPLAIVRTSHHTVATRDPVRALRLLVGILGGEIVDVRHNPVWGSESTFVRIGDDTHELAVPLDETSHLAADLARRDPLDSYYSIGFLVDDLDRVARTLERCGIPWLHRSETAIVSDPAQSIGVPWGFYTDAPIVHGDVSNS
ncbi:MULTISPECIES: VOC family protein [unclassified Microbacterium]|uniref:VOC family protein n=1 Tax=unclassified Microbacterium TaxID=2609290 RepID=UPI000C2BDC3E|nr:MULTISPECIES: VOC family protein [unclassified Microbacterium]